MIKYNRMKYSIWVIPPAPLNKHLLDIIKQLADVYQGPLFEPHMTVLGNIDLELKKLDESVRKVAVITPKLNLSLESVSFSTTYFQNVLLRVKSTAELLNLNIELKKALNEDNNVFMPHISLLYGDHDMHLRENAAKSISQMNTNFTVDRLVLTPSTPNPKDWKHLAEIPLKG